MSKKSAKPAGPITRRQQVAAIRQVKGQEIAEAVSTRIREAVQQEVEQQLSGIKSTMFDLLDRVVELEQGGEENPKLLEDYEDLNAFVPAARFVCNKCNYCGDTSVHTAITGCSYLAHEVTDASDSDDRSERTEAVAVQQDAEVAQGAVVKGSDRSGEDGEESS